MPKKPGGAAGARGKQRSRAGKPPRSETAAAGAARSPRSAGEASPFRTFDDAFAWLAARTNYETMAVQKYDDRTYGLARVERLLADLGRPDTAYAAAQIVGSKGKGSTAAALASILAATGRRTGLFTSPHLLHARERIRIGGANAPDGIVRDALARLVPHADAAAGRREPLTFFELHTAAALLAFRAAHCEAVVLEAGMGGRLDATTAAAARIKVLTSVSLDHTAQLGTTREAIAAEKAACARSGVPLLSGIRVDLASQASGVAAVVEETCRKAGAPLIARGRDFRVTRVRTTFDATSGASETSFRLRLGDRPPLDLSVPLLGRHQAANAALAVVAALRADWGGPAVTEVEVRRGLAATRIRARLEVIGAAPLTFVDGAHTPASFRVLVRALRDVLPDRRLVFVVGMSSDKDVAGSLARLAGAAHAVVATSSGQPRALPADELAAMAKAAGLTAAAVAAPMDALAAARRAAGRDGVVVVTGSLYLCGAVLAAAGDVTRS